jgi:hypothetical protein
MADPFASFKDADPFAGFSDAPSSTRPRGTGTQTSPFDLSAGQSRTTIPRGAFYIGKDGSMRRNDNADRGNPIIPPPRKAPGAVQNATGFLANLYRGTGVLDEANAGVMALGDVIQGRGAPIRRQPGEAPQSVMPLVRSAVDTYKGALARQRESEDEFAARRPVTAGVARNLGTTATVFVPGGAPSRLAAGGGKLAAGAQAALVGGAQAYGYGLADRGTFDERVDTANRSAPVGAIFGGTLGAAFAPRRNPLAAPGKMVPPRKPSSAETLRARGVQPTLGQSMGGIVKQTEDVALRAPILGPAIAGARDRVNTQFNRGVALEALKPIGAQLPKDLKPGFETVRYVDDALGKVYDDAAAMVPAVMADEQLAADLAMVAARKSDLPETLAAQYDSIIANRLARLERGPVTGETVKGIQSELRKLAREQAAKGEESLAGMLDDAAESVMGLVSRASPEAGAMIRQADEGWRVYSMMNDAAAAATNREGVFLPGQFNMQVRRAGRGMGSNMTGKGLAPLQDYATAAADILPDQFGQPGSGNVLNYTALGAGAIGAPVQTAAVVGGLAAGATPYLMAARRVVETLPPNAGRAELVAAQRQLAALSQSDPAVAALLREVQARLGSAGGVAGALTMQQPASQ